MRKLNYPYIYIFENDNYIVYSSGAIPDPIEHFVHKRMIVPMVPDQKITTTTPLLLKLMSPTSLRIFTIHCYYCWEAMKSYFVPLTVTDCLDCVHVSTQELNYMALFLS